MSGEAAKGAENVVLLTKGLQLQGELIRVLEEKVRGKDKRIRELEDEVARLRGLLGMRGADSAEPPSSVSAAPITSMDSVAPPAAPAPLLTVSASTASSPPSTASPLPPSPAAQSANRPSPPILPPLVTLPPLSRLDVLWTLPLDETAAYLESSVVLTPPSADSAPNSSLLWLEPFLTARGLPLPTGDTVDKELLCQAWRRLCHLKETPAGDDAEAPSPLRDWAQEHQLLSLFQPRTPGAQWLQYVALATLHEEFARTVAHEAVAHARAQWITPSKPTAPVSFARGAIHFTAAACDPTRPSFLKAFARDLLGFSWLMDALLLPEEELRSVGPTRSLVGLPLVCVAEHGGWCYLAQCPGPVAQEDATCTADGEALVAHAAHIMNVQDFPSAAKPCPSTTGFLYPRGWGHLLPPLGAHSTHTGLLNAGTAHLRPEFVRTFRDPAHRGPGRTPLATHEPPPDQTQAALRLLAETVVPQCALALDALTAHGQLPEAALLRALPLLLHWQGCNLRYMPHVFLGCRRAAGRQLVTIEMLARALRQLLRASCSGMLDQVSPGPAQAEQAPRQAVVDLLNTVFGPPETRTSFWVDTLMPFLLRHYPLIPLEGPPVPLGADGSPPTGGGALARVMATFQAQMDTHRRQYREALVTHLGLTLNDPGQLRLLWGRLTDPEDSGSFFRISAGGGRAAAAEWEPLTIADVTLRPVRHESFLPHYWQARLVETLLSASASPQNDGGAGPVGGNPQAPGPSWRLLVDLTQAGLHAHPYSLVMMWAQGAGLRGMALGPILAAPPPALGDGAVGSPPLSAHDLGATLRQSLTVLRAAIRGHALFGAALAGLMEVLLGTALLALISPTPTPTPTPTPGSGSGADSPSPDARLVACAEGLRQALQLAQACPDQPAPVRRIQAGVLALVHILKADLDGARAVCGLMDKLMAREEPWRARATRGYWMLLVNMVASRLPDPTAPASQAQQRQQQQDALEIIRCHLAE
ncbi:hypothetical protein PAPYR_2173 [Paratrimastix pyriformis]|uniref:Uncharacterized protein n=1 Tax=Paratrimastix pyriformis TaxID=342808 RepID=A0ABQ8UQZ4_9EUKA|nr:hypothetical protein PAPYR_2173 [Paratrimastix pyriformis]